MSNPIYQQYGMNNIIQQFEQFKRSFNGNPQQMVQELLNSGRISQEQYNSAVQMAQRLQGLLGIR